MGKRSDFERVPNDLYRTFDPRPVRALLPHLAKGTRFVEPCAGYNDLTDQLTNAGHKCVAAFDIDPRHGEIQKGDALTLKWNTSSGFFITNPPWRREVLHAIIKNLCRQAPTWLLFDAEWLYTDQSSPYLVYLRKVVAVGRVCWIPGTTMQSKESVAWYLFDGTRPAGPIEFIGRS